MNTHAHIDLQLMVISTHGKETDVGILGSNDIVRLYI